MAGATVSEMVGVPFGLVVGLGPVDYVRKCPMFIFLTLRSLSLMFGRGVTGILLTSILMFLTTLSMFSAKLLARTVQETKMVGLGFPMVMVNTQFVLLTNGFSKIIALGLLVIIGTGFGIFQFLRRFAF